MKAIMISIRPKWVEKILNGEKTIEIRKTMPKCDLPIDVYIYCTKGKEKLWRHDNLCTFGKLSKDVEKQFCAYGMNARELDDKLIDFLYINGIKENISRGVTGNLLNGIVVAKFTLNKVEEISWQSVFEQNPLHYLEEESGYATTTLNAKELKNQSCLTDKELTNYLTNAKTGYAIYITNLEIFDKPKELSEFCGTKQYFIGCESGIDKTPRYALLTKAPQSWCYVEVV